MPAKNRIKVYAENGYYHIYNRGVEKRKIYEDEQDKGVFLSYLKEYLSPKDIEPLTKIVADSNSTFAQRAEALRLLRMNNFSGEIDLLCFCLMDNHFHLLVKQKDERAIEMFMRSLCTRYVQYFNHRHERRVGGLFQDAYKAVLVESEEQLVWLTRYIHRNPLKQGLSLKECPEPSSYPNYLGLVNQIWVKPDEILALFAKEGFNSYEAFVDDNFLEEKSWHYLENVMLDEGQA